TGAVDIFAIPWVVDVVERVHASQAPAFSGLLSYLFAGDTPLAAHLGPRSGPVWHYWLPAYAREHARFSPGIVLLTEMARHARELGVEVIDLGKGDALYKRRLTNGSVEIVEGTLTGTQRAAAELRLRRVAGRAADRTPAAGYLARRSARRGFA
ncbi:MAG TPA: GNAT family N-acetyltransferase, partial [Gaiellaceae bacterium]|nr:GNAT family N-acetyltransferase [Gaiellaceae bacterium]